MNLDPIVNRGLPQIAPVLFAFDPFVAIGFLPRTFVNTDRTLRTIATHESHPAKWDVTNRAGRQAACEKHIAIVQTQARGRSPYIDRQDLTQAAKMGRRCGERAWTSEIAKWRGCSLNKSCPCRGLNVLMIGSNAILLI